MYKQIAPVSKVQHSTKRIKRIESLKFAAEQHLLRIVGPEFARVAQDCPVVFIKDQSGGTHPFALAGIRQGENVMIDRVGRWRGSYLPAVIRRYPFILVNAGTDQGSTLTVAVDEGSGLLSDDEGERLFDDSGEPTGPLKGVLDLLGQLEAAERDTRALCEALIQRELLQPFQVNTAAPSGRRFNVGGILAVDERRFNQLPDDVFLDWRRRGWLAAVYSHLFSLAKVPAIIARADREMGAPPPPPAAGTA